MFSYWVYATLYDYDNEDQADPYWETDQMVQTFSDTYKNNFDHGWKVTVYELILWGLAHDQP